MPSGITTDVLMPLAMFTLPLSCVWFKVCWVSPWPDCACHTPAVVVFSVWMVWVILELPPKISSPALLVSAPALAAGGGNLEQAGNDLPAFVQRLPGPVLFAEVQRPSASFSQWWTRAMRDVEALHQLPGFAALTAGPLFDAAD